MDEIILTVFCLAYNHEKYIRKTLEGFVSQKTKYKFKVIVHDDASTDATALIIREYADKYPDLIFPIFQEQNQYSKGVRIFSTFIKPMVEGKYLAMCEGDDYWLDEDKIEIQLSYLEEHPECHLCVHNTEKINEEGKSLNKFFNIETKDRDYTAKDVIEAGGGGLFHLSSFMYLFEDALVRPEEFYIRQVGDYSLAIWLSTLGNVHYFGRVMSAYRVGSINSWVKKNVKNASKSKKIEYYQRLIDSLKKMSDYTKGKYKDSFGFMIDQYEIQKLILSGNIDMVLKNKNYKKVYKTIPVSRRIKMFVKGVLIKLGIK